MAAPTWVAAGTFVSTTGDATPGLPAGWQQDDIFLLFVEIDDANSVTAPDGWTQATNVLSEGGTSETYVFWRRATSLESDPTITDPGNRCNAIIHAFRGCTTSGSPVDVSATSGTVSNTTTLTLPSVTTTQANCMVVLYGTAGNSTTSFSGWTNAGLTGVAERSDNSGSADVVMTLGVATGVKATAGSTGTSTVTASSAFDFDRTATTVALRSNENDTNPSSTDSGVGTETELISGTVTDSDSGVGTETQLISELKSNSDFGTGSEAELVTPATLISSSDSGTVTESEYAVDPDELDYVALTDQIALKLILGLTDVEELTDLANVLDLEPTIGMSRPFTYDVGWKDIINKIETTSEKRYPTFTQETVWSDDSARTIFPGEPYTYKAKAQDPFYDARVPVAGLKSFSGSEQIVTPEDYDFLVESGSVSVSLSRTSGQSADITVTALDNTPATISNMALKATPVRVMVTLHAKDEDKDSQSLEGVKTPDDKEKPSEWANINDSRAIMEIILDQRYKKLPFIEFRLTNGNAIRLRSMLDHRLSDRIDITETETFTDDDFYIEQIKHTISNSGLTHETMIGCEQIPRPIPGAMIFDDPDTGFNVGVFGERANKYSFDENLFIVGQSTLNGSNVLAL